MTLQQLRFLSAVAQSGLNVTAAAQLLGTSQPAISKQIKLLERELGFNIFVRNGRLLTGMTSPGEQVVARALHILRESRNIKGIADELKRHGRDSLVIGTTHGQARYVLPTVVRGFMTRYPRVHLHLHQGSLEQLAELARLDRFDVVVATDLARHLPQFVQLPCYTWHPRLIVPRGHALSSSASPTLTELATHPLITNVSGATSPAALRLLFGTRGLACKVALTAQNADIIKTYVRMGIGVGIIASVAYDATQDADLVTLDASGIFGPQVAAVGFPRGALLRRHVYDFVHLCAPHLERSLVERAAELESNAQVDALFEGLELPQR